MNPPLQPFRLPPYLTWRSYIGGRELRAFHGLAPGEDDHLPEDWVVRCEIDVGGHRLPQDARYMGLELDDCMEIFDFTEFSLNDVHDCFLQSPCSLNETDTFVEEQIIDTAWRDFFRLRRVSGTGDGGWQGGELMVLIVTEGAGMLDCGSGSQAVKAGETWLLPGAAERWKWVAASPSFQVLLAQPPR